MRSSTARRARFRPPARKVRLELFWGPGGVTLFNSAALTHPGGFQPPGRKVLTAAVPMENPYCSCKLSILTALSSRGGANLPVSRVIFLVA